MLTHLSSLVGRLHLSLPFLLAASAIGCLSTVALADEPAFPRTGLMPKQEIGALRFLERHADYDGRGTVVAVFDTGVDPGAEGLQKTSDGKPKIVDLVDATGSGDVDTSTVKEAKEGVLTGLSGRSLAIPKKWNNPKGKFHLGMKAAYELFPRDLLPRIKSKRKEKFDERQRAAVHRLEEQIASFDRKYPKPNETQKKYRGDLKKRLEHLQKIAASYDDPGPVFDCVVFHDGEVWRAAIDTDEDGKLDDEALLTDFRREHQHGTFSNEDLLNFAVNIYDQGNLLSIVADAGAHGTHVAGIIAGYYPDEPELNGIAPGAQIVGVKIGDTRVGSSSLGTGPVRGLNAVLANKCDLINMSYGGPTPYPNQGRINEQMQQIVDRHGVIFVASAGNSGPALSTVGGPGGTTTALLGVGAYASPDLIRHGYSVREDLDEIPYTWTSRGPVADGAIGVDVTAPGGAWSSVPTWTLQRNMLMNGTSMSSPNTCGGLALLLSGMKAEKLRYTPYSIRKSLINTARALDNSDVFSHGAGLIQIDSAWDYLAKFPISAAEPLRYELRLPRHHNQRGIYLREPEESRQPLETSVQIKAVFHRDAANQAKVAFQKRLVLRCDADWVSAPEFAVMPGTETQVTVRVDPSRLEPGVHYTELQAFDAEQPAAGRLFRLPITVIRADELDRESASWQTTLKVKPGELQRNFVHVPKGATWADLRLESKNNDTQRRIVMHVAQLVPELGFDATSLREFLRLQPNEESLHSFPVVGGRTLEVCIAQYWSSLGEGEIEAELTFHGLTLSDTQPELALSDAAHRLDVTSQLRDQQLQPTAQLTTWRQALRPDNSELRPLSGTRDRLPEQQRWSELVLTYSFELAEKTTVTPTPVLNTLEGSWSQHESHLWQIFDHNKRLHGSGTVEDDITLDKGKYTLRYHLRDPQMSELERFEHVTVLLDHKLSKPISLSIYSDQLAALSRKGGFAPRLLRLGEQAPLHLAPPKPEQLPKGAAAGDVLLGTIKLGKVVNDLDGAGQRPEGYPVRLSIDALPNKSATASASPDKKDKKEDDKDALQKRLTEARLAHLASLREKGDVPAFESFAKELLADKVDQEKVLIEWIRLLDDKDRKPHLPKIVELIDRLLEPIDTAALAQYFGTNQDPESDEQKKKHEEMEKQKAQLIDLLYRKARAVAYMDLPAKYGVAPKEEEVARAPESKKERTALFEKTFAELRKWTDTTEPKTVLLHIRWERRNGRQGAALELLDKHIGRTPATELLHSKRVDVFHELKWAHWRDYERQWMLRRFPPNGFPPF